MVVYIIIMKETLKHKKKFGIDQFLPFADYICYYICNNLFI